MTHDLVGCRFGRLRPMARAGSTPAGKARWRCICDCGSEKVVTAGNLKSGQVQSCGCLQREVAATGARCRSLKHGHAVRGAMTGEYRSYRSMLSRCFNPNATDFQLYGGRGISVCDRWRFGEGGKTGFDCFLLDMGKRPSPRHSIDRFPNGDGHYEPGNCRWATPKEQGGNGVRKAVEVAA